MKKTTFGKTLQVASLTLLTTVAGHAWAEGSCRDGFKETQVFGSVETWNISGTQQVGSIELELVRNENGKTLFNLGGTITGRIISQPGDLPILLDHVITFEDGSTIETNGDTATPTGGPGGPLGCDLPIEEVIGNFWGTGVFKRASGTIVADGTIDICGVPGNTNSFSLGGTVCLAPSRKER